MALPVLRCGNLDGYQMNIVRIIVDDKNISECYIFRFRWVKLAYSAKYITIHFENTMYIFTFLDCLL